MKIKVPLHSLVIMVGEDGLSRKFCESWFPKHEVVSERKLRENMTGIGSNSVINDVVSNFLVEIVMTKLRLGERVVVNSYNQSKEFRMALAQKAIEVGAPVFYLLCREHDTNKAKVSSWDIIRGDGLAEVLDGKEEPFFDLVKREEIQTLDDLNEKYKGITVFGDLHGMFQTLLGVMSWPRSRNHFIVFLGDILDYGPGSLETVEEVYRMVMRGEALLIMGNHEKKILRFLELRENGEKINLRISDGNRVTIDALDRLDDASRKRWIGRFRALAAHSHHVANIGNVTFAHAAIHPEWWNGDHQPRQLEQMALYGEIDRENKTNSKKGFSYSYKWTESVPENAIVLVGHDIRSRGNPVVERNEKGGMTVFLDNGCGKGGHLTTADLRFTSDDPKNRQLKLENFNSH